MKKILAFLFLVMLQHATWADILKRPLQDFTAMSSMEVRCVNGMQTVSIPVPERWSIKKFEINLHYTVSNALLPDVSQLSVKVNGTLVTQLRLNRQGPDVSNIIDIPPALLKPGYNDITFQAAQHYLQNGCEQVCDPSLWTNISLTDTTVEVNYDLKPIPLKLGLATDWIFDPKVFPDASVNLIADMSTAESAGYAAMAASGIARRFDYRKVSFTHSLDVKPNVDNILIGTASFVGNVLLKYGVLLDPPKGGLIRIFYLPKSDGGKDGLHALLVVTGSDTKALRIAAETFANMTLPYPGTQEMNVYSFVMPDISMYGGRSEIAPDKKYAFKTIGMESITFNGLSGAVQGGSPDISFRLPPDFLIEQNQYAKLVLNFSYGSGMMQDSALDIVVNGIRVQDIHLNNQDGAYISGYKVQIPTYLFKPGENVISFQPYLNVDHALCKMVNINMPFVSLYKNSTLYFPSMPHFVQMPKLELFTLNGFPFTRWPDGYKTLVYLPKHDDASIDTALNLIGTITQKNGFPLFGLKIAYSDPGDWDGEMLVVGEIGSLPASLMKNAPLQPQGVASISYPVSRGWDSDRTAVVSKQQSGIGAGTGLVMEFESPKYKGRSVIMVTAQDANDMRTLGDALLDPGIQASLFGDVSLIRLDLPKYQAKSVMIGKIYSTGQNGGISAVDAFLYDHTYLFYALVAAIIILLSMVGFLLMRRYRKKRTKVTSDEKRE